MASIAHRVGTNKTFVGCFQHLIINGYRYDFRKQGLIGDSEFGVNVGEFSCSHRTYCLGTLLWDFKTLPFQRRKGDSLYCGKLLC